MAVILTRPRSASAQIDDIITLEINDSDGTVEASRVNVNTVKWLISAHDNNALISYEIFASRLNNEIKYQIYGINSIDSSMDFLNATVIEDNLELVLNISTNSVTNIIVRIKQILI